MNQSRPDPNAKLIADYLNEKLPPPRSLSWKVDPNGFVALSFVTSTAQSTYGKKEVTQRIDMLPSDLKKDETMAPLLTALKSNKELKKLLSGNTRNNEGLWIRYSKAEISLTLTPYRNPALTKLALKAQLAQKSTEAKTSENTPLLSSSRTNIWPKPKSAFDKIKSFFTKAGKVKQTSETGIELQERSTYKKIK